MLRVAACCLGITLLPAANSTAAELLAVVKEVKADQRMIVFAAGGREHAVRVPSDAKVVDAEGEELREGLASKQLQLGVSVTLTVEAADGKRVLRTIRLEKAVAPKGNADTSRPNPPKPSSPPPRQDTSGLTPLTDLGSKRYQGFEGGLYPEGRN
ncbi:MAG: hypothetical protein ACREHD_28455, partial [Pirellulales bacterium]